MVRWIGVRYPLIPVYEKAQTVPPSLFCNDVTNNPDTKDVACNSRVCDQQRFTLKTPFFPKENRLNRTFNALPLNIVYITRVGQSIRTFFHEYDAPVTHKKVLYINYINANHCIFYLILRRKPGFSELNGRPLNSPFIMMIRVCCGESSVVWRLWLRRNRQRLHRELFPKIHNLL